MVHLRDIERSVVLASIPEAWETGGALLSELEWGARNSVPAGPRSGLTHSRRLISLGAAPLRCSAEARLRNLSIRMEA